jgi:hypothetical protein
LAGCIRRRQSQTDDECETRVRSIHGRWQRAAAGSLPRRLGRVGAVARSTGAR